MKTRSIIGAAMIFAGLFLAVCTADDSPNELAWRLSGVALLTIGAIVGDLFETYEEKKK